MNQPKKSPPSPTQAATPAPNIILTPSAPPADGATTSPPSESPNAEFAARAKQAEANAEEFIILIRSMRGTLHALMAPKDGPGAIARFHSADAASLVLTSNPICLNNTSCILRVEGL